MTQYTIAGGGVAGVTTAREIKKLDPTAVIDLYCSESTPYYFRPRLWEFIAGRINAEDTLFRPEAWYEKQNINLHLNSSITHVDSEHHQIHLKNQDPISYDRLLIATGSSSFVPPIAGADHKGVFALRTMKDAIDIVAFAESASQVVVIGGGLLGLETAKALKDRGLQVTVIEFFPYLLPRQLDIAGAEVLTQHLENQGLNIIANEATQTISPNDTGLTLKLKSGKQLNTDMVVFSTGIRSNISPWKDCGLNCNRGIQVDPYLQTNFTDIFAAGDVAEFEGQVYGIIPAATEQAKIAAANMVNDKSKQYTGTLSSTKLKVAGMEFSSIGEATAEGEAYYILMNSQPDQGSYERIVLENGKIIGAIVLGNLKRISPLKKLISAKTDVSAYQDQLMNPDFDLKSLL